ncbi:MAG TPA: 6-phosphogluconolactonase [Actinomycetota bacterium]|nr:6-phosphogluconolactonase [Actinomycetota bacterium]
MSPAPHRVLEVVPDAEAVARRAAEVFAAAAREAIAARGRFTLALSGGRTPWRMFRYLAGEDLPWGEVGIWQVDERVAPDGDPERNITGLAPLIPSGADLRPMPVTEPDLEATADRYAASLPEAFDLVHLGMGEDGHTASLVPGDPVLDVIDRDVVVTGEYRGLRRMTVTYPVLDRASRALWLITGSDKAPMVPRLLAGDRSIPSGRVGTKEQLVVVDAPAAAEVAPS